MLGLFLLQFHDRAADMSERGELLSLSLCVCSLRCLLGRFIYFFVPFVANISWYPFNFYLCSMLGRLLDRSKDMSGKPLTWAGVRVLYSLDGRLRICLDVDSCPEWPRLLSAVTPSRSSTLYCYL